MPLFGKAELDTVGLLCRPTVPATPSAQTRAHENTGRVLTALADWGALKTESVAALCFPSGQYSQSLQLAQRKLKALAASKMITPRIDAHGSRSWILTATGGAMVGSRHGFDLSPAGSKYSHTHLGARYLIFKQVSHGYTCYSEHAFTHNRCPFRTSDLIATLGKIPDGVLLTNGSKAPQFYALETEVSIKSEAIISRQIGVLDRLGRRLCPSLPHEFAGLIVLFPADMQWHASRLASAAKRRWAQRARPQELADCILIARAELGVGWSFKGVTETKLIL